MSDWQAGRWLGWDGRWRDGAPPDGWWQSADGRWHAPDAPASRPHANPAPPGGAYLDPAYHGEPDIRRPADEADAGNGHTGPYADEPSSSDDTEWADEDGSYSFGYSYTDTDRDEDDPDHTAPYGTAGYDPSGYRAPPHGPADAEAAAWPEPSSAPFHTPGPPAPDRTGRTGGGGHGILDRFGTWPTWVQIAVPATIGLLVLGLLGAAFGEPENDTTAASGTTATAAAAEPTTTAAPPSTTAPPPTTAPPTTPPTTLPTTTTAAPPPTPPPTAAPTAAPPDASGCHPSYTGNCVPANAIDVDCRGGQGDGPDYVDGPLQVVGPDVYDLDGNDNDGTACES